MYYKTGILVGRSKNSSGANGNGKPIEPMTNSTLEKSQTFLNNIFTLVNVLRGVTAINESADASTPSPDALVGTSAMALQGTENALEYLYHADRMMHKNLAESTVLLIQNAVKRRKISGFIGALGSTSAKFWEVNKNISLREFGISVMPRATQEERTEFYRILGEAYEKGTIALEDFLDIKEIKNMKLAANVMRVRSKRRQKEAADSVAMSNDQQAQNNIAIATAAEKEKQNTINLDWDRKKDVELQLKGMDRTIQQEKDENAFRLELLRSQNKLDAQHIQADAKVVTTQMQGEHKLELAEKQGKEKPKQ